MVSICDMAKTFIIRDGFSTPADQNRFAGTRRRQMARVSYVEPQNAPPEVKEIYEKVLKGKPGNIQKALAHQPQLLKTFLPFYGSIGRSLGQRLYEMIYIRVAYINNCQY
jgi:alkylhydroperoxidase family enzyme